MASTTYNIPQAMLKRDALEKNNILQEDEKRLGRFKPTFPLEIERKLIEHLKLLETWNRCTLD